MISGKSNKIINKLIDLQRFDHRYHQVFYCYQEIIENLIKIIDRYSNKIITKSIEQLKFQGGGGAEDPFKSDTNRRPSYLQDLHEQHHHNTHQNALKQSDTSQRRHRRLAVVAAAIILLRFLLLISSSTTSPTLKLELLFAPSHPTTTATSAPSSSVEFVNAFASPIKNLNSKIPHKYFQIEFVSTSNSIQLTAITTNMPVEQINFHVPLVGWRVKPDPGD